MSKDAKTKLIYETPVVVDLGELSRSLGHCQDGSVAMESDEKCLSGGRAFKSCKDGITASKKCTTGTIIN